MLGRAKILFLSVFQVTFTLLAEFCILLRLHAIPKSLYRIALNKWPGEKTQILSRLGFLYERTGNLEKATECYEEESKLEPHNGSHYWDLGCVYEKQDRILLAIENYEKALQFGTDFGMEFRKELQSRVNKLRNIQHKKN